MNPIDLLIGTPFMNALCVFFLLSVIFLNRKHLLSDKAKGGTGYTVLFILLVVYSVFYAPAGGDNFTSLDTYYSYQYGTPGEYLHYEPIYFRIQDVVTWGYVPWRFVVWGAGAVAAIILFKYLKLDKHMITLTMAVYGLPILFYYQRAAMAYCLLYLACAIFVSVSQHEAEKPKRAVFLAILLCAAALPFHTIMIFYLLVAMIALLVPFNKYSLVFVLICGGILLSTSFLFTEMFQSFMPVDAQATMDKYMQSADAGERKNIGGIISFIVGKLPFYVMLAFCAKDVSEHPKDHSRIEQVYLMCTVILIIVSVAFAPTLQVAQGKFYKAAMLPWSLFLAMYFPGRRKTKRCQYYVYAVLLGTLMLWAYGLLRGTLIPTYIG